MEEVIVKLREEQTRLTKILVALDKIEKSEEWQTFKSLHLDHLVEKLKRQVFTEATATEIHPENLYRLQGELKWAKKYADLEEFARTLKGELEAVKKRIQ